MNIMGLRAKKTHTEIYADVENVGDILFREPTRDSVTR